MSSLSEPDLPPSLACLKHMDTLLRCPICFDYLNITMITHCSHNFCSLCIRKFLSYKLQCPVCNSTMTESDLRNNRILDDLVRTFQEVRSSFSKTTFESPPISPKMPHAFSRSTEAKTGASKMDGTILSHFFQKKVSPVGSGQPRKKTDPKGGRAREEVPASVQVKEEPVEVKEEPVEVCSGTALPPGSPSTSRGVKPVVKVECPVCSVGVPEQYINKHLDSCLTRDEKKDSLRSSGSKRKPLTKLVYKLLSSQDLKKRLRDMHLSAQGTREQLERRHQEFVHLYNAQCDSLNPLSVEEIAKEVEKNEKIRSQLQTKSKAAMVFTKNQTEDEIDEMHLTYRKQHSSEFSRLISQVRGRLESSRKAKVKQENGEGGSECGDMSSSALGLCSTESHRLTTSSDVPERLSTSVMSEVEPMSPSPTPSVVSISSSISDVFSPEPDRSFKAAQSERSPGRKRRASTARDKEPAPLYVQQKRSRRR